MKCPRCQHDNRDARRFCAQCGASFALACPSCGFSNEPGEKFCGGCGLPLVAAATPSLNTDPSAAERRQLTVMFCDLVGSTALAEQLDPEEFREVVRAYQEECAAVIGRFEGHIAQYLGDGLLVYFGYPKAHEDDARRAVRTGLEIVATIHDLNDRLERAKGVKVAVRVGMDTGPVVVGQIGTGERQEQLALGETPNLAARLQGIAETDAVVISGATHRLVKGLYACRELGAQTLKGISTPVPAYRVLGESGVQGRLEVTTRAELTPLVGREQEVGLLLDRWEQVKDGLGQVVLVSGEPGIGKSRLVQVLQERVAGGPHVRWECRCSPYHQDSALYPVIDLVQRALEFGRDESPREKFRKIETGLGRYGLADPEAVSLWASLLSVPPPDGHPPLNLTPQRQKQKTLEGVVRLLLALAAYDPLLFIVEDLHWVDPSTLELLDLVVGQVPSAPVLTVFTARPDFREPWAPRAHIAHLTMNRFTRKQTELMVERVAGGKSLPAEVLRQVVAKTDGVPLFVEELTKMVLESGLLREHSDRYDLAGPLPPLAIPATLQDSLMARLDRLASGKDVAQLGATLGRSFSYELLQSVSSVDEPTLQRALAGLVEAELLYQRGVPPEAIYIFKHALIQEAAYQSLLKSRRQQFHQRIAQVLTERFPETAQTQPELLAHHYTEAGLSPQAIDYWQRAGHRAVERSANVEATAHFTRGIEILKALPESRERLERELALQTALGPALMSTKGFGSAEVEAVYARALELCQQVGDTPRLFSVLRGLWECYELRGELAKARPLGEQLLSLAHAAQDSSLLLVAHDVLGDTLFWLGEFRLSREHVEEGIALYQPSRHHSLALVHGGYDPGVACRSFAAYALWYLGYPDQALRRAEEALVLSRKLSHAFTQIFAEEFAAVVHQYRREGRATQERAEVDIALSTEQGNAFMLAHGLNLRGWALAQQGQHDQGIAQIHQGMAGCRATGAELERPHWLALLAEAHLWAEQIEQGLAAVAEGLAHAQRTAARFNEAELLRLNGELRLKQVVPDEPEAETCFRQAIDIARRQQAKSLELRAAVSLGRLWQRQGKREAARRMLADVYGWFTEGFDTRDLNDARALLEQLS